MESEMSNHNMTAIGVENGSQLAQALKNQSPLIVFLNDQFEQDLSKGFLGAPTAFIIGEMAKYEFLNGTKNELVLRRK